jgi:hypothetical protein
VLPLTVLKLLLDVKPSSRTDISTSISLMKTKKSLLHLLQESHSLNSKIGHFAINAVSNLPYRKSIAIGCLFAVAIPFNNLLVSSAKAQIENPITTDDDSSAEERRPHHQQFCPGNRMTNGRFNTVTGNPATATDEDIHLATGWTRIWQNPGSSADLFIQTQGVLGNTPPSPASGNYAGMWIVNRLTANVVYREGMLNKLTGGGIANNSGTYQLTFKTAAHLILDSNASTRIGIYGVRRTPTSAYPSSLPPAPGSMTSPSNLSLFDIGANNGNTVLLGTATLPPTANNQWQPQNITFNAPAIDITHIMVTKLDTTLSPHHQRYVSFDDFCLRRKSRVGGGDPVAPNELLAPR